MAFNGSHAISLSLALLLTVMATTPYVAKGTISVIPAAARIVGNIFCTPTGNPSPIGTSPPLVNATVDINCLNIARVTARTDGNGFFNATLVPPLNQILNLNLRLSPLISNCQVTISLPVPSCPVLPVRGVLRGVLTTTDLLVDNLLVGNVLSGVNGTVGGLLGGAVVVIRAFLFSLIG